MATALGSGKIKLNDGKVITAEKGGWYDGQQFWNDTLSTKGVINSQSDQEGAGQAVSAEVNRAGSVAAGLAPNAYQDYIYGKPATSGGSLNIGPTSSSDLPSFLDGFQSEQYNMGAGDLATSLLPKTPAPTPINRVDMLNEQRDKYGVAETEDQLNTLKQEERLLRADLRAVTGSEEGKTVALGVMGGRISEEQRQAQTKLDYLTVQKATLVDELTTKYNTINTIINYQGLDYQDAVKAYDAEFDKNLRMATFLSGEKQNAITNARANLTTVMNLITSGNMSYDQISNDEKLQIQKLEVQSGLPVGTMSRLQVAPKDQILGFSDDKTQAMVMDGNGGFKVIGTGLTKSSGSGSATEKKQAVIAQAGQYLNSQKNSYGHVGPDTWDKAMQAWMNEGLPVDEFSKQFRNYTDPNRGDFEQVYGFPKTFRVGGDYPPAVEE